MLVLIEANIASGLPGHFDGLGETGNLQDELERRRARPAETVMRLERSANPAELMLTRYAPGSAGTANRRSDQTSSSPSPAGAAPTAVTSAPAIGRASGRRPARGERRRPGQRREYRRRNRNKGREANVRLSLRVTHETLYPTDMVGQDLASDSGQSQVVRCQILGSGGGRSSRGANAQCIRGS